MVHRAIERCHRQGVEVSVLSTLMNTNYDKMDRMVALGRLNGCNLRVNAYQAVKTDAFRLKLLSILGGLPSTILSRLGCCLQRTCCQGSDGTAQCPISLWEKEYPH